MNENRVPISSRCERAISLVEVMIAVLVLGTVASIGFGVYGNFVKTSRETKAQSDVATLNRAVTLYLASGGEIDADTPAEEVIRKLKSREVHELEKYQVGLTGSKIDSRLSPVLVKPDDEGNPGTRIRWDPEARRFEFQSDITGPGIAYFDLNDSAIPETIEESFDDGVFSYARESTWIWDYEEKTPASSATGPTVFATTPVPTPPLPVPATSPSSSPPPPPPTPGGRLDPPVFSIAGGTYPLNAFQLALTLTNPNPAGAGRIFHRLNASSSWTEYTEGAPLSLPPNIIVDAYVAAVDSSHEDSIASGNIYWSAPVALALNAAVERSPVSYYDLVESSVYARARVSNLADIPAYLQTPGFYEIVWTLGSLVLTAEDNGGDRVTRLGPGLWGPDPLVVLMAQARVPSSEWVQPSAAEAVPVVAEQLDLPAPEIRLTDLGGGSFEVELNHSGKTPPGAEIYYNLDGEALVAGADPSEPENGILYTDTFVWKPDATGGSATLVAAAVPPSGLDLWFAQSGATTKSVSVPSPPGAGGAGGMALVKESMTLDGRVVGGIRNLNASSVMINSTTDVTGDIALSGSPNVTINGSPDFDGVAVAGGPATPSGYPVIINSGAKFGKLITRSEPVTFPSLAHPPSTSGAWISVDSPSGVPANWFPNSGVNLNPNAGSVQLPPGTYGTFTASNINAGGAVILGNSSGAPAVYNFQSFTLNSGVPLRVLGPVTINTREFAINSGSQVGNAATKDKLTINVSGGQFIDNSSGTLYADTILVPNGATYINGEVHATVTTKNLTVNSTGVLYLEEE